MFKQSLRVGLTLLIVAATVLAAYALWQRNYYSPWTRDARVRADIIELAPDVSGVIAEVAVSANQVVQRGDLLFRVDDARYRLAAEQAEASVQAAETELKLRRAEMHRRERLDRHVISAEERDEAAAAAQAAAARLDQARSRLESASLDLARTEVRAPVDGHVTNLNVQPGDYAQRGEALLALVDSHSFRVDGYFEESKIQAVRIGATVRIRLLGGGPELHGHVDSIARAIADSENAGLLSNVDPNFHWVRLAQRIPVRIVLDEVPGGLELSAGMTCTVIVEEASGHAGGAQAALTGVAAWAQKVL